MTTFINNDTMLTYSLTSPKGIFKPSACDLRVASLYLVRFMWPSASGYFVARAYFVMSYGQ